MSNCTAQRSIFLRLGNSFSAFEVPEQFVVHLEHFQMSRCIVQMSTRLSFDSSFGAVALLQHFCFSLRKPPHEQLHCSKEHIFVL